MFDLLKTNEPEDSDMSFWDHLDHLRPRLLRLSDIESRFLWDHYKEGMHERFSE